MPTVRTLTNGNQLTDWTEEVNELDNQYGLFNGMGLFKGYGIGQTSVVFDKNTQTNTLIPQASRKDFKGFANKERKNETFALGLPYFMHNDRLTGADVQGWRAPGTPDTAESVARLKAEKLEDMVFNMQQNSEFMKVGAIKGITLDGEGNTIANMFTEFGISQKEIDFDLDTAATEQSIKISELKSYVAKEAKAGGAIGRIEVPCSQSFFDKLKTHATMKQAYQYYQNSGKQLLRDDLSRYESWGIVNSFEFEGVLFYSYDATFLDPDGSTTRKAFEDDEGYSIVKGSRNLYRAYFGPSNTLSGANMPGKEFFMYEKPDEWDQFIDLEIQSAPLFILMKPQVSVRVYT